MKKLSRVMGSLLLVGALLTGRPAGAADGPVVRVAVAANFTAAMKRIAAGFERVSGDRVLVSFGSTGSLYAQIRNGAPYDLFLAADERRPRLLEGEGAAVPGSRFTYAVGRLVLWSAQTGLVDRRGAVLGHGSFTHLAIANPKTAPYGAAAEQVLRHLGLWEKLQPRIVRGENIAQTYQFTATGNAQLGMVALSEARNSGGSRWDIPQNLYTPIRQQAVLLVRGRDNPTARALLAYLKSDAGRRVIHSFGYGTE
jgi:molybdate transport system substrate-binding protein